MGGLLNALAPRMRRASFVLLPAALVIGLLAFAALQIGLATTQQAGGLLALAIVLFVCGALLFVVSLLGRSVR